MGLLFITGGLVQSCCGPVDSYRSKVLEAEGQVHLTRLGHAAKMAAETEHADGLGHIAPLAFPLSTAPACTDGGQGEKVQTDSRTFEQPPWNQLRFSIDDPHVFAYCYQTNADGSAFAAWATADLDGQVSKLCLQGHLDPETRQPIVGQIVTGAETCAP